MKDSQLVSVIVPVYNVGDHLRKCLESLVGQTYRNIEIILVNDGSTDDSGEIIDEFAKRDGRIKAVHKENGGVSSARNKGLSLARGDYITFVDADDIIDVKTIKLCLDSLKNNEDIATFSMVKVDETGNEVTNEGRVDGSVQSLEGSDKVLAYYLSQDNMRAWSHLFKAHIAKNVKFDNSMRIHEDAVYTFEVLKNCKRAAVINQGLYFYSNRSDSAMKRYKSSDIDDVRKHYEAVMDYVADSQPNLMNEARKHSIVILFNLLTIAKLIGDNKAVNKARNEIKANIDNMKDDYIMRRGHKVKWILAYLPTFLFRFAIALYKGVRGF